MLEAVRVFLIGASELPDGHVPLARQLSQRLMTDTNFVLVTGGLVSMGVGKSPALDGVLLRAALGALEGDLAAAQSRIVTILPDRDLDSLERTSVGAVVRVSYTDRRTRRFSSVLTSDAVIAINGASGTKEMIDLAFAAGKPLIPLPTTGGAALEGWKTYEPELIRRLHLRKEDIAAIQDGHDPSRVASACLEILSRAVRPRCFVAMPFLSHPLPNAFETIRAVAEEQGFQVIRVDQENFTGSIVDAIWDSIRHSDIVVADLTGNRPNVYYELGISHALHKPTLLTVYSRNGNLPDDIPFDIKVQRVIPYGTIDSLRTQVRDQLTSATRAALRVPEASRRG